MVKNRAHVNSNRFMLTLSIYLLMMAYAFSNTMIGPLLPHMIDHYRLDLGQGGFMVTLQSIGGILAILIGGFLADIFKKSRIVIIGFSLYFIGLLVAGSAPSYAILLFSFFVIGVSRMVDTVLNAYIADLYPEKRSTYLNLLHSCFGIGAFLGPLFVQVLLEGERTWNQTYRLLSFGCMALLLFFVLWIPKTPDIIQQESNLILGKKNFKDLLTSRTMWILCSIMFLYSGHQNGISVWLPMYMESYLNASPALSGMGLSAFWLGIIAGRLGASFLPPSLKGKKFISIGSLLGGLLLGTGLLLKLPVVLIVFSGFTGLLTGAIIPMLVAMACDKHPQNSGTASSMIFISGTLASMVLPWSIGKIADKIGFQAGMSLTAIPLIFIFVMTMFMADS